MDRPYIFKQLLYSGPGPGTMVQQSNFLGSQPNFVGYQAAERNSFSGDLFSYQTEYCFNLLSA
jgi:U11/U12 small nuclear ribonucleoprotein SNRNP20